MSMISLKDTEKIKIAIPVLNKFYWKDNVIYYVHYIETAVIR